MEEINKNMDASQKDAEIDAGKTSVQETAIEQDTTIEQENKVDDTATSKEKSQEETKADESPKSEETKAGDENKTFTQDQVNEFIKARLERENKKLLNRYGVEKKEELDDLVGKAQSYDSVKEEFDKQKQELSSLSEKLAFIENNINENRFDDVRAYFKGKNIEFNDENLKNELLTHPEWLNVVAKSSDPKTTIEILGSDTTNGIKPQSEEERALKLFGLK